MNGVVLFFAFCVPVLGLPERCEEMQLQMPEVNITTCMTVAQRDIGMWVEVHGGRITSWHCVEAGLEG